MCGTSVEPLRARAVIALEDGLRFLCSPECRDRFLRGERHRERSEPPRASASASASSSDPMLRAVRKRRSQRPPSASSSSSEWTAPQPEAPEPPVPLPVLPLAVAGMALVAAAFATSWTLVGISAVLTGAAAALAVLGPLPLRRDAGWLAWATAPSGASLACVAALLSFEGGHDARLALAGAALAAAAAILRAWLDASAARPLERLLDALRRRIPARAQGPVDDATRPLQVGSRVLEADRVRAGEEVIVSDGGVVPVDGVVRAGEGYVLAHPAARSPVRRRAGDPVIAGARVIDGAIRVLATRVGEHRALLRPARFGDGTADDAARVTRITTRGIQWGGLAVLAFGVLGLWLGDSGGGLAMRLSAAAGVLVAVPLLSLRRAAEAPFVAAGATAAERGIVFQSARSLDRAGRVRVVALCTHGTITEGEPEVVEVHPIGEGSVDEALGLAAAAEASLEGNPIARAILRHVERRRVAKGAVRRVTQVPGRGITAVGAASEAIVVGSRQLLLDEGISVAVGDVDAERAEKRGLSVVFVGVDRKLRALVMLRDEDRPGARAAVQRLIDLDAEVLLVSGDHRSTVESLARPLDVDHVKAELTPEERGAEVRRLREAGGGTVAVIGRAGPDDVVLAAADVPVVLAAAGSPEGERAIALTGDDVRDAAAALWLANAARREANRAVAVAATAGLALAVLAANGLAAPGVVALGAIAVDVLALPAAARLLRRIELRLPARG
ncbi:Lead, cadmium, zinc and mercury transporting ATPase [Sandaracinus amylolyticus]|uniref:Lead, cadmium, zinc and mercury transporting ATPase n=1 Tax=Sandaracinus amylolyticus TaxID=927083 RepID=A0A0F6SFK0_9BACT|nr:Lead, cadmium, zinc and mercury transporting ATPase [Sandaracinus amylolyticus]